MPKEEFEIQFKKATTVNLKGFLSTSESHDIALDYYIRNLRFYDGSAYKYPVLLNKEYKGCLQFLKFGDLSRVIQA